MQRKKILWLVSWYPNRSDKFDGDFIQRHARVAALHHDIHVILVKEASISKEIEAEWHIGEGLTEQIIYYNREKGPLKSIQKQWRWRKYMKQAVADYIRKHGLPYCVHVHVPWKAGLTALSLRKKYGIQYLVTEHWGVYNPELTDNIYRRPFLVRSLLKKIYEKAIKVLPVSEYLGEEIGKFAGIHNFQVIPNVVDTALFYPQLNKHETFTFIHVSNMAPVKNVESILKAFKILVGQVPASMQLIMIGNRDQQYVKVAEEMGLLNRSVFFRGEIPYEAVADEMRRAHVLVMYSVKETFSCVSAEALCCGLPVVLSDAGALPELVSTDNGLLVPTGYHESLAMAMEYVYNNYSLYNCPEIAKSAAAKYSIPVVAGLFDDLYNNLKP